MSQPFQFQPSEKFWQTVGERQKANEGHIRNIYGHGPFVGTVGEIAFEEWFKVTFPKRSIRYAGQTWHDFVVETRTSADNRKNPIQPKDPRDELFIEVKTKLRRSFPSSGKGAAEWEVSVPDYLLSHLATTPKPDLIFAVSVQSNSHSPTTREQVASIFILGAISYSMFHDLKVWIPKGTQMGGGRASEEDMWNIFIRQLGGAERI